VTATKLGKHDVEAVQERISFFAAFCSDDVFAEQLERYIEQSRPQYNGTLDAILPHFMSITDMRKAQANLRYLCGVARHILDVRKLAKAHIEIEADRAGKVPV
jgi:hypothetical protein